MDEYFRGGAGDNGGSFFGVRSEWYETHVKPVMEEGVQWLKDHEDKWDNL